MDKIKILNPKSGIFVNINGAVAKKLYKMYLSGEIILNSDDLKKFENLKSPKKSTSTIKLNEEILILKLSQFTNIIKINAQGSSDIYNGYFKNKRYFIKDVVKQKNYRNKRKNIYGNYDIQIAFNEVLASKIYNDIYNIDTISLFLIVNDIQDSHLSKYMVASKALDIDTCEPITDDCKDLLNNKIKGVIEPFLVDCILSNWDVGIRGNIGIITNKNEKKAFRIDVGGALLYRALGEERHYNETPTEHETFFISYNNGYRLFKSLHNNQIAKMYTILENVEDVNFIKLKKKLIDQLQIISDKNDLNKAIIILNIIDIVIKRHNYYINNKNNIQTFLMSKVKI